jgi:hypothetical protein
MSTRFGLAANVELTTTVTFGPIVSAVAGVDLGRRSPWTWNVIEPTAQSRSRPSTYGFVLITGENKTNGSCLPCRG